MTNVVQCSLMQNNESGIEEKKKEKKENTYTCKLKHTHTQEQNK